MLQHIAKWIGIGLFIYVGAYFLLMDYRIPACDANHDLSWMSKSYFAPVERLKGSDLTILVTVECWINYLFAPLDWLVANLMPFVRQPLWPFH